MNQRPRKQDYIQALLEWGGGGGLAVVGDAVVGDTVVGDAVVGDAVVGDTVGEPVGAHDEEPVTAQSL